MEVEGGQGAFFLGLLAWGAGGAPQGVWNPGSRAGRRKGVLFWLLSCIWGTVGYTEHKVRGENRGGDIRGINCTWFLATRSAEERRRREEQ